ncbi:hypothetical protein [Methylibium sp. T29]|uniref:hypothetical protein n=1 Tax=Methylibium sp. T29 TaxID=1430884 RepID=UPI0003F40DDB|nr:hypothetical protein [Methylibium sp. T29]EWS54326.1 hypothetical protein X551_02867 [Methylibium sp. T29]
MSERERFEAWARTQPRHEGANMRFLALNNAYIDFDLHGAWLAWQAARSGQAASGSSQGARSDERTGWPPGLLQDDSRELSRALASKPDAMVHARDAVAKIGQPEAPTAAPPGWKLVPIEPTGEMLYRGHHQIDFDRSHQNTERLVDESHLDENGVGTTIEQDMRDAWAAMLNAAPPARSGAGSEEGQG